MQAHTSRMSGSPRMIGPRRGYFYAGLNAVLSGFAIYINSLGVHLFADSTLYTTLKNSVVGVALLLPVLVLSRQRAELARLTRQQWGYLLLLAVIGGSASYALYFRGLQLTTVATGSLIYHAQFLVVALLAVFLLRERIGPLLWVALAVLLIGTSLGTNLHAVRWDSGALLVVLATVLFAGSFVLAKYLLRELSTLTVMAAKMSIGSALLVTYVAASGRLGAVTHLSRIQWAYTLGTGVLLLAFTVTAFLALRYASATAATAIPAASPIITTLLVVLASRRITLAPADALGLLLILMAVAALYIVGQRDDMRRWRDQHAAVAL